MGFAQLFHSPLRSFPIKLCRDKKRVDIPLPPSYCWFMDLIQQLEAQVEECNRIIEKAKSDRATFVATLELLRKRGSAKTKRHYRRRSKATEPKTATPISLPLVPVDASGQSARKTDAFRRFIKDHPGLPKQAVMAYGNKGIPGANKNFGYTAMAKMLERTEVELREGKVYPTSKLLEKLEAAEVAAS